MKEAWVILAFSRLLQAQPQQEESAYTFTSLPVINVHGHQQALVVSVWASNAPVLGKPRSIYLPVRVGSVRYADMAVSWQNVTAASLGVSTKKNEYNRDVVGVVSYSQTTSMQQWLQVEKDYKELLSVVLEKGWLLPGQSHKSPEEVNVARRLKQCLPVLEDEALSGYYQTVGKDFHQWLDTVTR